MYFFVFQDLLFQPHVFWQYSIISKPVKFVSLLHIIVTYIKENIITKLRKSCSPSRNLWLGNKLPTLFLKIPLCTGDLSPVCKILIERPVIYTLQVPTFFKIFSSESSGPPKFWILSKLYEMFSQRQPNYSNVKFSQFSQESANHGSLRRAKK